MGEIMASSSVTLRNFDISDVDDVMVWATDEEVTPFCTWEAYKSREEVETYIRSVAIPHPWYKAICLDGKPIGSISVNQGEGSANCRGEVGYVIARKYWGKGFTAQAVKLVLSKVFREMRELERVEGLVEPENVASQRVLEKAGFVKEGLLCKYLISKGRARDFYIYRFLSSDLKREDPL
eukprot:Gb_01753 [translate_table: standard]